MQPNGYQPPSSPTQPPADPYAFLYESQKKPNPLSNLISGGSFKGKLVFGLAALLVIVILIAILKAALSSGPSVNMQSLYSVMSEQQEILNLASIGSSQSQNPVNQDFATTVTGVITTDQSKLIKLLGNNNIKVNPNLYVLQPSVDSRLTAAQQTSTFDPLFVSIMEQQFGYYKKDLSNAYAANAIPVIRSYLSADYKNINLLLAIINNNYS